MATNEINDPFFEKGVDSGVKGILLIKIPNVDHVNGAYILEVRNPFYGLRGIPWAYLHRDGKWRFGATHPETRDMFTGAYFQTRDEAERFLLDQKPSLRILSQEGEELVVRDGNGNFIEFLRG